MVSYTTVSPLPVPFPAIGGLVSVALSVGSPRLGVTQLPVLWSPDFPRLTGNRGRLVNSPQAQASFRNDLWKPIFL